MKTFYLVLVGVMVLGLTGCWSSVVYDFDYSDFDAYTEAPQESHKELGRVGAVRWAHWSFSCKKAATFALGDTLTLARRTGGNALANVIWLSANREYETPHCRTHLPILYSLLWVPYWGTKTTVSASAILIEDKKESSATKPGVYAFDPAKPVADEARRLVGIMMDERQNSRL